MRSAYSASTVTQYEAGRITPPGGVLKTIANLFKVSVDDLLNDEQDPTERISRLGRNLTSGNSYIDSLIRVTANNLAQDLSACQIDVFMNNYEVSYRLLESLLYMNYNAVKNGQKMLLLSDSEGDGRFSKVNMNIENFCETTHQDGKNI